MNIAGEDAPLIAHPNGSCEGFSAGACTGVQNPQAGRRIYKLHSHPCRAILHIKQSVLKSRQLLSDSPVQQQTALRLLRNRVGDLRPCKGPRIVACGDLQGIYLEVQRGRLVVGGKEGLRKIIALSLHQFLRKPQRMAVAHREVFRGSLSRNFRQIGTMVGNLSQHCVDKSGRPLSPVPAAEGDGFVHRRAGRHAVEKQQLRRAEAEDIPHLRLQLSPAVAADQEITVTGVFQHAEYQAGREGRVSAVQIEAANAAVQ